MNRAENPAQFVLGGSCMMNKYLLGSLIALLGWTSLAQAQGALGTPISAENSLDPGYGSYPQPAYPSDGRPYCKPKPTHPVLAQIARTMMSPIRAATARLQPPAVEETPTKDEIARMIADGGYSQAEVAAAKIKIDEAQGRARRAAVKYLGTIDCHYYPEVEIGLVAALRADRVESVRYEAALALGSGRGLTFKMLEALNMTALGVELDGNPAETSDRVRCAARLSLYRCACRGLCLPPEPLAAPAPEWLMPEFAPNQPTNHDVPMNTAVAPPVSPQERQLAETISSTVKTATPATPASRPLHDFLLRFTGGRDSSRDARNAVDPRLRGLSQLGSETTLAIPTTPPITIAPALPYYIE